MRQSNRATLRVWVRDNPGWAIYENPARGQATLAPGPPRLRFSGYLRSLLDHQARRHGFAVT